MKLGGQSVFKQRDLSTPGGSYRESKKFTWMRENWVTGCTFPSLVRRGAETGGASAGRTSSNQWDCAEQAATEACSILS